MKFFVLFIFSALVLSCEAGIQSPFREVFGDVNFVFLNSLDTSSVVTALNYNFSSLIGTKYYSNSKSTVVYVHGWNSEVPDISTQTVIAAYRLRGDHNIIAVDWRYFSKGKDYIEAASYVRGIAGFMATILKQMQASGMNLPNFHFVGHSLGAQILGRLGYVLNEHYGLLVRRITGLDPAGLLFVNRNEDIAGRLDYPTLNKANAQFVDIMHTDGDGVGSKLTTGHIDFRPNGGKLQAGCIIGECQLIGQDVCITCSHSRAWKYYAESVKSVSVQKFIAKRCSDLVSVYSSLTCFGSERASMGFYADKYTRGGNYYVETNKVSPYSK